MEEVEVCLQSSSLSYPFKHGGNSNSNSNNRSSKSNRNFNANKNENESRPIIFIPAGTDDHDGYNNNNNSNNKNNKKRMTIMKHKINTKDKDKKHNTKNTNSSSIDIKKQQSSSSSTSISISISTSSSSSPQAFQELNSAMAPFVGIPKRKMNTTVPVPEALALRRSGSLTSLSSSSSNGNRQNSDKTKKTSAFSFFFTNNSYWNKTRSSASKNTSNTNSSSSTDNTNTNNNNNNNNNNTHQDTNNNNDNTNNDDDGIVLVFPDLAQMRAISEQANICASRDTNGNNDNDIDDDDDDEIKRYNEQRRKRRRRRKRFENVLIVILLLLAFVLMIFFAIRFRNKQQKMKQQNATTTSSAAASSMADSDGNTSSNNNNNNDNASSPSSSSNNNNNNNNIIPNDILSKIVQDAANDIRVLIQDDIALGAKFVRLGFHDCVGGCDGCVDLNNPSNGGLLLPIVALQPIVDKHETTMISITTPSSTSTSSTSSTSSSLSTSFTRADIWALAALVGAEMAQENAAEQVADFSLEYIGRLNCEDDPRNNNICLDIECSATAGPDRTLPSADITTADLFHYFFQEFGFNSRETVALMGAHTLGTLSIENSGIHGPNGWVRNHTMLDNDYYIELVGGDSIHDSIETLIEDAPPWVRDVQSNNPNDPDDTTFVWNAFPPNPQFPDGVEQIIMLTADIALVRDINNDNLIPEEHGMVTCAFVSKVQNEQARSSRCPHAEQTLEIAAEYKFDNALWLHDFEDVFKKMLIHGYNTMIHSTMTTSLCPVTNPSDSRCNNNSRHHRHRHS